MIRTKPLFMLKRSSLPKTFSFFFDGVDPSKLYVTGRVRRDFTIRAALFLTFHATPFRDNAPYELVVAEWIVLYSHANLIVTFEHNLRVVVMRLSLSIVYFKTKIKHISHCNVHSRHLETGKIANLLLTGYFWVVCPLVYA